MRRTKSSQKKMMLLSALHVLTAQGLLQAGWKVVPWPVHSRLRSSSSTSAAVDGAPLVIVAEVAKFRFFSRETCYGENRFADAVGRHVSTQIK